jgi:hypothetical protein
VIIYIIHIHIETVLQYYRTERCTLRLILSHNLKFEVSLVGTAVDCSFLQGTSVIVKSLFSKSEKRHGSRLTFTCFLSLYVISRLGDYCPL